MISGFSIKVFVVSVIVGAGLVELGSPLIVSVQFVGLAGDAVSFSALTMFQSRSVTQSRATAEQVVSARHATLKDFQVDTTGAVTVTVEREAPSLIAKRWLKTWYDVEVSASAVRTAG